jgi:hypothetical protein
MGYRVVDATYTRPDSTTQYTANDALSDSTVSATALTFSGCASRSLGSGRLVGVSFIDDANQSTLPTFELNLFNGSAAPTATKDNTEFGLTDANAASLLGIIAFSSVLDGDPTSGTDGNAYKYVAADIPFVCGLSTNLYGLVKVTNTYTPVSGEVWRFRLHIQEDE